MGASSNGDDRFLGQGEERQRASLGAPQPILVAEPAATENAATPSCDTRDGDGRASCKNSTTPSHDFRAISPRPHVRSSELSCQRPTGGPCGMQWLRMTLGKRDFSNDRAECNGSSHQIKASTMA